MQKIELIAKKSQTVIDEILQQQPNLNYSVLKTALRKKDVRINDNKVTENKIVQAGDKIILYLAEKQTKRIDVIYQDENILVVFKPQGMEVTKTDKTFLQSDCLEDIFENCFACHRIDKNTEGLVVLAKNEKIRDILFDAFKNHHIKKFYKAIVTGEVKKEGENLVDFHKKENEKIKIYSTAKLGASKIQTNYILEKQVENLSLLDIEILTGKTHQIRAQLAHHNIFIVGDERYGKKGVNKFYKTKKQLLCAYKLCFEKMPNCLQYLNAKTIETKPLFLSKYGF